MKPPNNNIGAVLFVGNAAKTFTDPDSLNGLGCERRNNIADAIDAAAKNRYQFIGVAVSDSASNLKSALQGLRKTAGCAKIILLAQMWQEPAAISLTTSGPNGRKLADEYLICPARVEHFRRLLAGAGTIQTSKPSTDQAPQQQVQQKIAELEKLATTDELTGLKNRRYIWEFADQIINRAEKNGKRVTLLIFDIDNFKHYNDLYGHTAGDQILKQTAMLIRRSCRAHDIVGRIGGDEFAVIFWDNPADANQEKERRSTSAEPPKEAIFIAKRFRSELNKAEFDSLGPEGKGVLSISGGLASFPRDASDVQKLIRQADSALLQAKKSGKNMIYLVGTPQADIENIK